MHQKWCKLTIRMKIPLAELLDIARPLGLALTLAPDGRYLASLEDDNGKWSPHAAGSTPSEAIAALFPAKPLPPPPYQVQ
jgi:hypothetical protein